MAELLMRRAQQGSRAEAEDENRDGQRDGGEQETDAGEHLRVDSASADQPAKALEPKGNAVTTWLEVDRPSFAAANQA